MSFEKGRVFTGCRARLIIKGTAVGYARNCSGGETLTYERIKVLDRIETLEHVPTDYDVRFTAGEVRIIGETLKSASRGIFPRVGANAEEHLSNVLTNGDLLINIQDNQTDKLFMTLEQARCTSNNWTIDAMGVVGVEMEFVGIRMRDETEV
jgi:hypothetical protein